MFKNTMTILLAGAFAVTAMPKFSFAQEQSVEEVMALRKAKAEEAQKQLLLLKSTLSDMQIELQKEQGKFGYVASKWARNLSLVVAVGSAIGTVVANQKGSSGQLIGAALLTVVSSFAAGLSQIAVVLTNDQVVELNEKITKLQQKIAVVQAELNQQNN